MITELYQTLTYKIFSIFLKTKNKPTVFKNMNYLLDLERCYCFLNQIILYKTDTIYLNNLYNKTRHSYKYMLCIAGQTAGPIGLNFFVDTHVWPGGVIG